MSSDDDGVPSPPGRERAPSIASMAERRARGVRRTRRRWILLGVLVLLLVWGAFVVLSVLRARNDTRAGIDELEQVQQKLTPGDLLRGSGVPELRAAGADFASARRRVRSPFLLPLRILPFVGRQVRSVDTLTGSAARVVDIGVAAVDDARGIVNAGQPVGAARVTLVEQLAAVADRSDAQLQHVDLGPTHLIGPLADARTRFETRLDDLRHAISQLKDSSHGLARFLKGPSRYLVLAANNAEMRVGSGTFLSIGVLTVKDGTLQLGTMQSPVAYPVPDGAVPLTGDLRRWAFLKPNVEWRSLGASPQFPAQAMLASQMWKAATGTSVDGVLAIDVVALKDLLAATGPVRLDDGTTVTADDVLGDVMLRQYLGIVGYPDQSARRDRLSDIARGALAKLETGGWHAADLVDQLRGATRGRHLLAWSANGVEEAGWTASSIDGALASDEVLVGLHNRGGNKLDQFMVVKGTATTTAAADGWSMSIRLAMTNATPASGLPQYVVGPFPGATGAKAGLYQGFAVFELPVTATHINLEVDGKPLTFVSAGPDGPSQVVAGYVEIPRGLSRTVVVRFDLPGAVRSLLFAPSARVPAIAWMAGNSAWNDDSAHRVKW